MDIQLTKEQAEKLLDNDSLFSWEKTELFELWERNGWIVDNPKESISTAKNAKIALDLFNEPKDLTQAIRDSRYNPFREDKSMKSAEEILRARLSYSGNNIYAHKNSILEVMEEYANQFKQSKPTESEIKEAFRAPCYWRQGTANHYNLTDIILNLKQANLIQLEESELNNYKKYMSKSDGNAPEALDLARLAISELEKENQELRNKLCQK